MPVMYNMIMRCTLVFISETWQGKFIFSQRSIRLLVVAEMSFYTAPALS